MDVDYEELFQDFDSLIGLDQKFIDLDIEVDQFLKSKQAKLNKIYAILELSDRQISDLNKIVKEYPLKKQIDKDKNKQPLSPIASEKT